jgi:hypothetical protein
MKRFAVLLSLTCLLLWMVAIHSFPTVDDVVSEMNISITDGAFQLLNTTQATDAGGDRDVMIAANQPIPIRFLSTDFVYVVQLPCIDRAILVLPDSSVNVVIRFPTGQCRLQIMPGCGSQFRDHSAALVLHAI